LPWEGVGHRKNRSPVLAARTGKSSRVEENFTRLSRERRRKVAGSEQDVVKPLGGS